MKKIALEICYFRVSKLIIKNLGSLSKEYLNSKLKVLVRTKM